MIRKEVEPPEITAVKRILETARAEEHPLYPCLHLIAYTGLRRKMESPGFALAGGGPGGRHYLHSANPGPLC